MGTFIATWSSSQSLTSLCPGLRGEPFIPVKQSWTCTRRSWMPCKFKAGNRTNNFSGEIVETASLEN